MSTTPIEIIHQVITLLMANGQTTHRVIQDTTRLATAYGLQIQMVPQWEGIACQIVPIDKEPSEQPDGKVAGMLSKQVTTELVVVRPVGVDMNKVSRTLGYINRICKDAQRLSPEHLGRALEDLQAIAHLPPASHLRFILMAGFGASALGIIFGVSDLSTLLLIFMAATLGAGVRRLLAARSCNLYVQPLVAALIAGLTGGLAQHFLSDAGLQFVEIAPCMILVPGAHILNASLDLVRGRLGLGLHRLTYSAMILLAVCTGLLLGLSVTGGSLASVGSLASTPLWLDILAAGVAVAAFAAFFSLPWTIASVPVIVGMIAHGSRWWVLDLGGGVVAGALIACIIAGTVQTFLSRRLNLPFAALAFASVVSLMPGIFVFRFADGLINIYVQGATTPLPVLAQSAADGTAALLIVLVMTLGLIIPKMLIEGLLLDAHEK